MNSLLGISSEVAQTASPTGTKFSIRSARLPQIITVVWLVVMGGCELRSGNRSNVMIESPRDLDVDASGIERKTDADNLLNRDWPQLFGPNRNCYSQETGLETNWINRQPKEVWRVPVGTGYSSPIVVNGRVIIQHRLGNQEHIDCIDAGSGQWHWRDSINTTFRCKYDYSSGPYSTPHTHDGLVYVVSAQAQLRCLKLQDGSVLWQRDLTEDYQLEEQLFGFGSSPIVVGDLLILNVGASKHGGGIMAFDRFTGETRWSATSHAASYATPLVCSPHGVQLLLVLTFDGLVCLDPFTGHVNWEEPFQSRSVDTVNATSPAVWKDMVVVMQGPGPGARCWRMLADGSHELVWKDRRVLDSQFNSLLVHNGNLFGFTAKREGGSAFRCVEFATGKLRWSFNSDIQRGSCIAADGRIMLWGENGHLGVLDLNDQYIANSYVSESAMLDPPCYSAPALSNGCLYLRNESYLVALDLNATRR